MILEKYKYLLPDIVVIALFACFLMLAASRQGLNHDAAYNMLSYQSLFDGNGFVYSYSGKSVPFDPVISTGPELYLSAFVLWNIFGTTDYAYAAYALVLYFVLFLLFFRICVLPQRRYGWLLLVASLFLLVCKSSFFEEALLTTPLGEPLAAFLVFAGLYLLYHHKPFSGFLLLGFALNTKTNIIVALLPTAGLLVWNQYVLPLLEKKQYRKAVVRAGVMLLLSGLMFVPNLAYTKIVPALVLDRQEHALLKAHQSGRSKHMIKYGFSQMIPVLKNPGGETLARLYSDCLHKLKVIRNYYDGSTLITVLFFGSLVFFAFQALKLKSFLFYVFVFSGCVAIWWVLFPYAWFYRYYAIVDLLYLFGAVGLIGVFFSQRRAINAVIVTVLILAVFVPQFSFEVIQKSLDDTELREWHAMKHELMDIDERRIFGLGWFQAPELMMMTHKRFQNYYDVENFENAKKEFGSVYLIATRAAVIFSDLTDDDYAGMHLAADHGVARLYEVR